MENRWDLQEKLKLYQNIDQWKNRLKDYEEMDEDAQGKIMTELLKDIAISLKDAKVKYDTSEEKYVLKALLGDLPLRMTVDLWFCKYNIDLKFENTLGEIDLFWEEDKTDGDNDDEDPWDEDDDSETTHYLEDKVYLQGDQEEVDEALKLLSSLSDEEIHFITQNIQSRQIYSLYIRDEMSLTYEKTINELDNPLREALEVMDFMNRVADLFHTHHPDTDHANEDDLDDDDEEEEDGAEPEESRFDVRKMTEFAIQEIKKFALEHQDETFYGFSIDASGLCLNSLEKLEETLEEYAKQYPKYLEEERRLEVKRNTGDWAYQEFAAFTEDCGFDEEAYDYHYYASDEKQKNTRYARAMDQVLENLRKSDAFDSLKKTGDFFITRVEHDY